MVFLIFWTQWCLASFFRLILVICMSSLENYNQVLCWLIVNSFAVYSSFFKPRFIEMICKYFLSLHKLSFIMLVMFDEWKVSKLDAILFFYLLFVVYSIIKFFLKNHCQNHVSFPLFSFKSFMVWVSDVVSGLWLNERLNRRTYAWVQFSESPKKIFFYNLYNLFKVKT